MTGVRTWIARLFVVLPVALLRTGSHGCGRPVRDRAERLLVGSQHLVGPVGPERWSARPVGHSYDHDRRRAVERDRGPGRDGRRRRFARPRARTLTVDGDFALGTDAGDAAVERRAGHGQRRGASRRAGRERVRRQRDRGEQQRQLAVQRVRRRLDMVRLQPHADRGVLRARPRCGRWSRPDAGRRRGGGQGTATTRLFPAGITLSGTGSFAFAPAGPGTSSSPAVATRSLSTSGSQTVITYWDGFLAAPRLTESIADLVSAPSLAGLTATSVSSPTYTANGGYVGSTYAGPVPVPGRRRHDRAPTVDSSNPATGQAKPSDTLTCASGTWSPTSTYAYAWQRGGNTISGQTGSTYTVTSADLGATSVTCSVTRDRGHAVGHRHGVELGSTFRAPTITLAAARHRRHYHDLGALHARRRRQSDRLRARRRRTRPRARARSASGLSPTAPRTRSRLTQDAAGLTATASAPFVVRLVPALLAIGSGPGQGSASRSKPDDGPDGGRLFAFRPKVHGGVSVLRGPQRRRNPDVVVAGGPGDPPEVEVIDEFQLSGLQHGAQVPSSRGAGRLLCVAPVVHRWRVHRRGRRPGERTDRPRRRRRPRRRPEGRRSSTAADLSQLQPDGGPQPPDRFCGARVASSRSAPTSPAASRSPWPTSAPRTSWSSARAPAAARRDRVRRRDAVDGGEFLGVRSRLHRRLSVAAGDVLGDGDADVVVGAGAGGGSQVRGVRNPQPSERRAAPRRGRLLRVPVELLGGLDVAASVGGSQPPRAKGGATLDLWPFKARRVRSAMCEARRCRSPALERSQRRPLAARASRAPSPTSTSITGRERSARRARRSLRERRRSRGVVRAASGTTCSSI